MADAGIGQRSWPAGASPLAPWLLALLAAVTLGCLAWWPVVAGDTDLWFHLDDARYLLTHHRMPNTSFFSFLQPARTWVDYAWLFQVMVYGVFRAVGYPGLIALRTIAYALTGWLVLRLLIRYAASRRVSPAVVFVMTLVGLVLIPRALLIRPHLCSYALLAAFLWILECRPERAWWLPPLAVLWANVHGMTYPTLLLVGLAYGAELGIARWRGRTIAAPDERRALVPLALSMLAVLATPHGLALLAMPATPLGYQSSVTRELARLLPSEVLTFQVANGAPSFQTVFNMYLALAVVAAMAGCATRRVRAAHLLLAIGATLLLSRGLRFKNEFVLLTLPLVAAHALPWLESWRVALPRAAGLVVAGVLALMPLRLLQETFGARPRYPLSPKDLPVGVARFLRTVDVGGTVFNHPSSGGYLRWMLGPDYRIHMYLGLMFTNEDFYNGVQAFRDMPTLSRVIAQYAPTFIAAPLAARGFGQAIAQFPDYVLVQFDDAEALYVDARQRPAVAAEYGMPGVDPFALVGGSLGELLGSPAGERVLRRAPQLLASYPDCGVVNQLMAMVYNDDAAFDRALPHAEAIVRSFPESPDGYLLLGDAWAGLRQPARAEAAYRQALARTPVQAQAQLYRRLGAVYRYQGNAAAAYRAFRRGIDTLAPGTSPEEVYELSLAAIEAGKRRDAIGLLTYLDALKLSERTPEWESRLERVFKQLGVSRPAHSAVPTPATGR